MRRAKIIATLGPATDAPGVLEAMVRAGVDVVRLNAAHSGVEDLTRRLVAARDAATAAGTEIAVMLDLSGPKIRVGEMAPDSMLVAGSRFRLLSSPCTGDSSHACVTYPGMAADISIGDRVLLDDGRIELSVVDKRGSEVVTEVIVGGRLTSNKGVNVPGVRLSVQGIADHDRAALDWAMEQEIDWVGQSFVRSAADVHALRELMTTRRIPIVAKIEKHEAVEEIDAIIAAADAVMVARGDLAVETAPERVPVLQRRIVLAARDARRPVIVATEMLDSMRTSTRPTRAEASDVANAIFGRTDAVMLSGETAVGHYPAEAVRTMVRIIEAAEAAAMPARPPRGHVTVDDVQDAVSSAVCELATDLGAAAIITLTQSGATALAVSRYRPASPIVAASLTLPTARMLNLVWGVRSVVMPFADEMSELIDSAVSAVHEAGYAGDGERVAITAGMQTRTPGGTDFIHVRTV